MRFSVLGQHELQRVAFCDCGVRLNDRLNHVLRSESHADARQVWTQVAATAAHAMTDNAASASNPIKEDLFAPTGIRLIESSQHVCLRRRLGFRHADVQSEMCFDRLQVPIEMRVGCLAQSVQNP